MPTSVFISYSHKDQKAVEILRTQLAPFDSIAAWDDSKIQPGTEWQDAIRSALRASRVAVLVVSPNFLASPFIKDSELPAILESAEREGLTVLWFPWRDSNYKKTSIEKYQGVGNPERPVFSLRGAERDKEWVRICQKIVEAVERHVDATLPLPTKDFGSPEITDVPVNKDARLGLDDLPALARAKARLKRTAYIDQLRSSVESYYEKHGGSQIPRILVCGQRGSGKTTTINTLFGKKIAKVGEFTTGTKIDAVYIPGRVRPKLST